MITSRYSYGRWWFALFLFLVAIGKDCGGDDRQWLVECNVVGSEINDVSDEKRGSKDDGLKEVTDEVLVVQSGDICGDKWSIIIIYGGKWFITIIDG